MPGIGGQGSRTTEDGGQERITVRKRSTKTAALYREWGPIRRAWLEAEPVCCLCGGWACDVHEILAGSHRRKAFVERACWLRCCRRCHGEVQGKSLSWQLALKFLSDPEGFNLTAFHQAWGRPATAVSPAEVLVDVQNELIRRRQ